MAAAKKTNKVKAKSKVKSKAKPKRPDYGSMLLYDVKVVDENGEIVDERCLDKTARLFQELWKGKSPWQDLLVIISPR